MFKLFLRNDFFEYSIITKTIWKHISVFRKKTLHVDEIRHNHKLEFQYFSSVLAITWFYKKFPFINNWKPGHSNPFYRAMEMFWETHSNDKHSLLDIEVPFNEHKHTHTHTSINIFFLVQLHIPVYVCVVRKEQSQVKCICVCVHLNWQNIINLTKSILFCLKTHAISSDTGIVDFFREHHKLLGDYKYKRWCEENVNEND